MYKSNHSFTLMDIKKYLPKRVVIVEVPINNNGTNAKAMSDAIKQIGIKGNIIVLENDKIISTRVSTKWF